MQPDVTRNLLNAFGTLNFVVVRLIEHTSRLSPDPDAFKAALKVDLLRGIADIAPRNAVDIAKDENLGTWHVIIETMFRTLQTPPSPGPAPSQTP